MKYIYLLFLGLSLLIFPLFVFGQNTNISIDANDNGLATDQVFVSGNYFGFCSLSGVLKLYNVSQRGLLKTQRIDYSSLVDFDETYIYTFSAAGYTHEGFHPVKFQIRNWEDEKAILELEAQLLNIHPQNIEIASVGNPFDERFKELSRKEEAKQLEFQSDEYKEFQDLQAKHKALLTIIDIPEGEKKVVLDTELEIIRGIYSPDGRYLYIIGFGSVEGNAAGYQILKYSTSTWKQEEVVAFGHSGSYYEPKKTINQRAAFSPDGRYLAIPAGNSRKDYLQVFEVGKWTEPKLNIENAGTQTFSFHANSEFLAVIEGEYKGDTYYSSVRVFKPSTGLEFISVPKASSFHFHPEKNWLLSHRNDNGEIKLIDFISKKTINEWTLNGTKISTWPVFEPNGKHLLLIEQDQLSYLDYQEKATSTKNVSQSNQPSSAQGMSRIGAIQLDPQGQTGILTLGSPGKSLKLDLNHITQLSGISHPTGYVRVDRLYRYKILVESRENTRWEVQVRQFHSNKLISEIIIPAFLDMQMSPSGKYLLTLSYNSQKRFFAIQVYSVEREKLMWEVPVDFGMRKIQFLSEKEDILILNAANGCAVKNIKNINSKYYASDAAVKYGLPHISPILVNIATGEVMNCWDLSSPEKGQGLRMLGLKEGKFLVTAESSLASQLEVKVVNTFLSGGSPLSIEVPELAFQHDFFDLEQEDSTFLLVFTADAVDEGNWLKFYKINLYTGEKEPFAYLEGAQYSFVSSEISPDGKYFFLANVDGSAEIWNLPKSEKLLTIYATQNQGYLLLTPDGYYFGTKGALENVRFSAKDQSLPFQQYDLKYNRPDIILSRFEESAPKLVELYRKAYEKRMEKMGFDENRVVDENHFPEIKVANASIPPYTDEEMFEVALTASDSKYSLDRLNIWVNDVPVFGQNGHSIKEKQKKEFQSSFKIPLTPGENQFRLSVMNEQGVESLFENFSVEYRAPQASSDLYLISIGVSEYASSEMNLNYAAKDAQDIGRLFSGQPGTFNQVFRTELLNQEVTRSGIQSIKQTLQKTKPNDAVVLYLSGHGLIDEELDYYLATYDVDFSSPRKNGIPYEELENLLDEIPARKKLILMDACHSGEIDKSSVELIKTRQTTDGEVQFRSYNQTLANKQLGIANSFEMMKELFVDLRRSTGASVISSASGVEFALEGEKWKNGVFTYAMLKGLQEKQADANGDGRVMVSELQRYLAREVPRMTDGQQQPTFRLENIANDWRIW
jgi:WD40 repeat protein